MLCRLWIKCLQKCMQKWFTFKMYKNEDFSSTGPITPLQTLLGNICRLACHLLRPHDKSPAALCTYSNRFERSSAVIWLGNECSRFVPEVGRCFKPSEPQDFITLLNCVWISSLCCYLHYLQIWSGSTRTPTCYVVVVIQLFLLISTLNKLSGFAIKCFEW